LSEVGVSGARAGNNWLTEAGERSPARHLRALFLVRGERFWRDALRRRFLLLADVAAIGAAALGLTLWGDDPDASLLMLAFLPGWVVVAKLCGLYDRDHRSLRHLTSGELPFVLVWAVTGSAILAIAAVVVGTDTPITPDRVVVWLALAALALFLRSAARFVWRLVTPPERALVVGNSKSAESVLKKLDLFPDIHVRANHVVESCSASGIREGRELPADVERVIVASPLDEDLLAALVAATRERHMKLSIVPPIRGMLGTAVQISQVADLPLVEYNTWDVPRTTLITKRALDLVGATVGLLLAAPVLAVAALGVKLTTGGPSFYVQARAGLHGRPFRLWKLRTMSADAEDRLPELVDFEALEEPVFKLRADPRVTGFGRFLRRTSVDELPQLLNVLRGEMSLVGPRPEQLELVEKYRPEYRFRLAVKPGLTGPMQVYGRADLSFEERLAVEREYVENLSVLRDLRILAMTVTPVLRRRGAY
jgi:exopolysaccharide biosynthesis polyprenyl glycosylphosphotransferase